MTTPLPAYLLAALRSPPGTTVDDILNQFPDLRRAATARPAPTPQATEPREADATQPDDPARTDDTKEFRHRLDDAIYTWQSRNGWRAVPHTIANALAERVIHEMRSERRQ